MKKILFVRVDIVLLSFVIVIGRKFLIHRVTIRRKLKFLHTLRARTKRTRFIRLINYAHHTSSLQRMLTAIKREKAMLRSRIEPRHIGSIRSKHCKAGKYTIFIAKIVQLISGQLVTPNYAKGIHTYIFNRTVDFERTKLENTDNSTTR